MPSDEDNNNTNKYINKNGRNTTATVGSISWGFSGTTVVLFSERYLLLWAKRPRN